MTFDGRDILLSSTQISQRIHVSSPNKSTKRLDAFCIESVTIKKKYLHIKTAHRSPTVIFTMFMESQDPALLLHFFETISSSPYYSDMYSERVFTFKEILNHRTYWAEPLRWVFQNLFTRTNNEKISQFSSSGTKGVQIFPRGKPKFVQGNDWLTVSKHSS